MRDDNEVLLAEYTAIQEFLRYLGDAQNSLFIFAFTASGAILSFSVQQESPYIAIVNFVVLIAVRCRVMWFRNNYFNQSAYVKIILEPLLQLESKKSHSVKWQGISVMQYFIYSFLGMGSAFVYILFDPYNIFALVLCIFLLGFVVFLDCYYFFGSNKLRDSLELQWTAIRDSESK